MLWNVAFVVVSLILLVCGAELLVRGASALARRAGISPFVVGVTIVGFGTSTPELFTSVVSGLNGQGAIAVGNVVGSNISNLAVILGLTALVRPIVIATTAVGGQLRIVIAVAAIPFVALLSGGDLGRVAGALMLVCLVLYVTAAYRTGERTSAGATAAGEPAREAATAGIASSIARILVGLGVLVGGSSLFVRSASEIAAGLGVSELTIGLTVVAVGTSAPELFTSLIAALRKEPEVAVANVFGSNVFNVLGVLGATCLLEPQSVGPQVLLLDAPVMMLASCAMAPILFTGGRISRAEGLVLFVGYATYVVVLLRWAPCWFGVG